MADKKLNTGPAENISPEAAEPIATPEQAAASEPQQEQTGPAIPESGDVVVSFDKINELIFKRFYRSRFSKDTQGIGLGLPLAKAIIEAHGGLIEVESELGIGTSFIMNFPIPTKL